MGFTESSGGSKRCHQYIQADSQAEQQHEYHHTLYLGFAAHRISAFTFSLMYALYGKKGTSIGAKAQNKRGNTKFQLKFERVLCHQYPNPTDDNWWSNREEPALCSMRTPLEIKLSHIRATQSS